MTSISRMPASATSNAYFYNVDLSAARFEDINFAGADLANCNIAGMRINGHLLSDLLALASMKTR
jgi:uncharacterized protein YjbI with pentapeptide repeats